MMKIKISVSERIFQVVNYIFLTLLGILCLYPLWHVLMASFSSSEAMYSHSGLLLWPVDFSVEAYKRVFANSDIYTGYLNTIKILVLGVSWQMLMTTICAYVLSRRDFLLRRPVMLIIAFTMFFSGGIIPIYMNIKDLHLLGSVWGLILPMGINTYNMIILRTSIESLPESLMEAARIDGAGHLTILRRIVLPLTKATLAVLVLYYGVAWWNEWFWSSRVLTGKTSLPLAVILRQILIQNDTASMDTGLPIAETIKYALIIVATVPVLCIYPFIQKYFTKGVMIGAVKE